MVRPAQTTLSALASIGSAALALQCAFLFAMAMLGQRVQVYNRAIAALAVAARFPGVHPNDSNDGNDDGNDDANYQEIGQNDSNDGNDSRIDLVGMDDLVETSPSSLHTLPPAGWRTAGPCS